MNDQAAADAMVDASFTGEGLNINGNRVYALYTKNPEKHSDPEGEFFSNPCC